MTLKRKVEEFKKRRQNGIEREGRGIEEKETKWN